MNKNIYIYIHSVNVPTFLSTLCCMSFQWVHHVRSLRSATNEPWAATSAVHSSGWEGGHQKWTAKLDVAGGVVGDPAFCIWDIRFTLVAERLARRWINWELPFFLSSGQLGPVLLDLVYFSCKTGSTATSNWIEPCRGARMVQRKREIHHLQLRVPFLFAMGANPEV